MAFELLGKAVRRFRLPVVDYSDASIKIVYAQTGDVKSRYFDITLYDDRGDIDLTKYSRVTLTGHTPDGNVLSSNQCEISPGGKSAIVQFSGGFTASPGRVACDITFVNNDGTEQLTSQTFYVIVSQSQSTNETPSENDEDYNQLLSLLKEVSGIEKAAKAAKENCETATGRANDAADKVQELLSFLPYGTKVVDKDDHEQGLIMLQFKELKGG